MGLGPIAIGKSSGIWTISMSFTGLQQQNPSALQMGTDYVLVWDSILGDFFIYPLAQVVARVQRSVIAGPVTILPTDQQLNLNLTSPTSIMLPPYTSRFGVPLKFKDVGMQATVNPITFTPSDGTLIDGLPNAALFTNGAAVELTPFNDGVNTGWAQT